MTLVLQVGQVTDSRERPYVSRFEHSNAGPARIETHGTSRSERPETADRMAEAFPGVTPKHAGLHQPAGRSSAVGRRTG